MGAEHAPLRPFYPQPEAPATFGTGTMHVNGTPARGTRPMLVLLVDFSDVQLRAGRGRDYYERLVFHPQAPTHGDDSHV
jgi:hypothetical protein